MLNILEGGHEAARLQESKHVKDGAFSQSARREKHVRNIDV